MKIVCISDTHNAPLSELNLPAGDLLIHAGDATGHGTEGEVKDFDRELGLVKDKYTHGIIFTPGNHDFLFEKKARYMDATELLTNAKCVIHNTIEIAGLKIFMSPYTPRFYDWAFNVDRGPLLEKLWAKIPEDTDILVTHGPPNRVLDFVPYNNDGHVGCEELLKVTRRLPLKLHVFGHIHCAHGEVTQGGTTFINACIMDESYSPVQEPVIWEIN